MNRLQVRPVRHGRSQDVEVLALVGELDLDSEDVLATAVGDLIQERQVRLVLDCGQLTFCDSRGLGLLLTIRQNLHDRGGDLVLAAAGPQLLRTLELTGADQVLNLADGVEEALDPIAPPEPLADDTLA
ncbi:STAS domain-containing protein [Streptomyces sp. H10-C2]|uniref:STAS domain-containing protein n=1 Tax=unclassified Streptomyces TaxID=2593676 RepID=UPI0024BA8420|nr:MULTISPECIES: STAS domain-containing protein [unclassified Streptomyces]MDJ0346242.1 STAS domain-containing protein [Streptomyces sp. PH10-H1]MDJ0371757.1 STAS domain-containing protein [Streptomyces sp. H10-C2]